jgi:transcriptional regulator with XRE-family HTH domain
MPAASQPPPTRTAFARRLRELRIPRGFKTARKLAQALGIDENRYTRYERAEVEPDLTMLMRICSTLEISPNDLFGIAESRAPVLSGFGESSRNEDAAAAGNRSRTASPKAARPADRRHALAWQLARELAQIETEAEPSRRNGTTLQTVQRTSRLFKEIEADPFAFVARRVETPPLTTLEPKEQARIVALMERLIEVVNRSTLE